MGFNPLWWFSWPPSSFFLHFFSCSNSPLFFCCPIFHWMMVCLISCLINVSLLIVAVVRIMRYNMVSPHFCFSHCCRYIQDRRIAFRTLDKLASSLVVDIWGHCLFSGICVLSTLYWRGDVMKTIQAYSQTLFTQLGIKVLSRSINIKIGDIWWTHLSLSYLYSEVIYLELCNFIGCNNRFNLNALRYDVFSIVNWLWLWLHINENIFWP